MSNRVGSTSWPRRNWAYFKRLAPYVDRIPGEPAIMLIGPGAATRCLSPCLADAANPPTSRFARIRGDLARYADQALRRFPGVALVSFEPFELREALRRNHRLIVVDESNRVLAAVKRDLPAADCHRIDIATSNIPFSADVVIAFNVISRTTDGEAATQHVARAVAPDGLLMLDDRSAKKWLKQTGIPFEQLEEKIYRRK